MVTLERTWRKTKLGEYIRIKHGYAFKGEFFADSGPYVLLTPGNFTADGGIKLKGEKEKYYTGDFPSEFLLKRGDFLIVLTDLTQNAPILGSSAFVKEDDRFLHNQRLGKIVNLDEANLDRGFLYYLFNSAKVRDQIKATATGATVKHTAPERIYAVEIELPSLPIQRKIAAILSTYDDLIENNTRRIAILEEMAQSLYREWFVHFRFPGHEKKRLVESELGLIPEGWEVVRFTDIADVLSGGTPRTTTSEYWNGTIPFFTPKDATSPIYVTETEKSITHIGLRACNSKLYPKNTVFITARGTVGKVVLSATDMAMNQSCYALQGRGGVDQFSIFLSIGNCIDQLKQNAHGAVFDTIIVDTFRMLQVVKPPLALTNAFKSLVSPIFELVLTLLNKNTNLRQTRDLLLPRLISGVVDVEELDIHVEGGTYESDSNKFPEIPSGDEAVHYSDLSAHV